MSLADEEPRTPTKRRLSFRKSLVDCSLPTGYLDALEQKRKSLDDSIHKYIASKEREFKQFEKELRHQAKRAEGQDSSSRTHPPKHDSPISAVDTLLGADTRKTVHDGTAEADFGNQNGSASQEEARRRGNFTGLFTPEYLTALDHTISAQTASEPSKSAVDAKGPGVHRTHSDTVVETAQRPRLPLTQRTSSSGSSIDGRLVSALKSASAEPSRSKHKRVSLAVGDTIVAPSDNVPLVLSNNRTASHSRQRSTSSKDRHAFLSGGRTPAPIVQANAVNDQTYSNSAVSSTVQSLQEQGSASAASATDARRTKVAATTRSEEDVGDMFDLEEDEFNAAYDGMPGSASPEDTFGDEIAGRVSGMSASMQKPDMAEEEMDIEQDEPPPDDDSDVAAGLVFSEGASTSKQPLSPGFRRPSVLLDPMYKGRSYEAAEGSLEDRSFYGSSFSRDGKGSFTSSSMGESYMARNAEKLMEMRAQRQDDSRQRQARQPSHALPVR